MNQNCCFPKQVRCQIIARFRLHIVTVFRAQISGGARWELGGVGVWVGIGTRRWKLSQRKNFNKAPAKALFSLVPVFKCKWSFQDLKKNLFPKLKLKNKFSCSEASASGPALTLREKQTNKQTKNGKKRKRLVPWKITTPSLALSV